MTRADLISKIQKLLALSRSSTAQPGESANALAMAQRLMSEHRIVIDDEAEFVCEKREVGLRITLARHLAMCLVQSRCGVKVVTSLPEVFVLGRVAEATFAGYAIEFLRQSCARAVSKFEAEERLRRRRLTPRKRSDFIQGWFIGVRNNWPKPMPSSEHAKALALQHDEKLEAFAKSVFPAGLTTREKPGPKMRESHAANAGFLNGRATHIRHAVDSGAERQLFLEG